MALNRSPPIALHAHRGLRWNIVGFAAGLATACFSMVAARVNPASAIVVIISGIGIVLTGRSLRAVGALIQVVQPPAPRWIAWLVPITFLIGILIAVIGARLLFVSWRPAP
jgi:predicted ABC-type sugar transport system permease subunit